MKDRKYWQLCDVCFQLKFVTKTGEGSHKCPDLLRAKREAELDMIIDDEMKGWEKSLTKFWDLPQVKFEQYLLEKEHEG